MLRWVVGAIALAVLAFVFVACADTGELEQRVSDLERELEARPEVGELIVVGTEINQIGSTTKAEFCVTYLAFGDTAETCIPFGITDLLTEYADKCFRDAHVGAPLPESCGAAP